MSLSSIQYHDATNAFTGEKTMVELVRISPQGTLLEIKEVPDKYRHQPYTTEEK